MSDNLAKERNDEITKYLNHYNTLSNPQYAVLINGRWGAGKTFFIKEYITSLKEYKSDEEDSIVLKPIYVSLNGLSSVHQISIKLKEALSPFLHSKGMKVVKKIFLGALKTATHVNFDTDDDGKPDGKVTMSLDSLGLLKSDNPKVKGNRVLIFDDLERCKIDMSEIFGYINDFVEHNRCKVILIGDEKKIEEKYTDTKEDNSDPSYKEFKEKLIGQSFFLEPDIHTAVEYFIETNEGSKIFFNENKQLIIELFQASKVENLRILKQALLDFDRFILLLDKEVRDHKKYDNYLISLLGHFLVLYLEYKSGNRLISDTMNYAFDEAAKENNRNLNVKYNTILRRFGIDHWTTVISYDTLIDFVNHGYYNEALLNDSVKKMTFFIDREKQDWEKLWGWEDLKDSEFDQLYQDVLEKFENGKFENLYVVIHVAMTIINLRVNNIISCNRANIVNKAKESIKAILQNHNGGAFSVVGDHSWSKAYRSIKEKEFTRLKNYTNKLIINHYSENKDDFLKNLFENLNDKNILDLENELNKSLPDRSSSYSMNPILVNIDGKQLADTILLMENSSLDHFHDFMRKRYFPEEVYSNGYLSPSHVVDLPAIIQMKDQIEERLGEFGKIKKHYLANFVVFLDLLIAKMEKLKKQSRKKK